MSWLARSFANSLRLDDDEAATEPENDVATTASPPQAKDEACFRQGEARSLSPLLSQPEDLEESQGRGVKEDLTELKHTLTRQFWGVASFLAPPPSEQYDDRLPPGVTRSEPSEQSVSGEEEERSDSAAAQTRISSDFAEIGGKLSKMASDYLPFGSRESEGEDEERNEDEGESQEDEEVEELCAVGITDEVLVFATNIGHHPETWLDFPLDPEEDLDDFHMSDAQREHASAIEYYAPRLAALRIELCPCHMSESYFWKVYFVLLHSRLNKSDAEILSTPQVAEARALWMKELQKQTKVDSEWYGGGTSYFRDSTNIMQEELFPTSSTYSTFETMSPRTYASEPASSITTECETEKHAVENTETHFVDKAVIQENPVVKPEDKDLPARHISKVVIPEFEDDDDDWPEEEDSELQGYKGGAFSIENEEDISFSDLEDDDDCTPIKSKSVSKGI